MASMTLSDAQLELINSLKPEEIPIKLRCATCSKLAVNAFRLPCCEQAICETCQSTLPTSCPICEHSPLEASDCSPHKSLRTTIRVFVRTEEKKRESLKPKDATEVTPEVPKEPAKPPMVAQAPPVEEPPILLQAETNSVHVDDGSVQAVHAEHDKADDSHQQHHNGSLEPEDQTQSLSKSKPQDETPVGNDGDEIINKDDTAQQGDDDQNGQDFGTNGNYQNMNYQGMGGDVNQMQMMMAMQNGMGYPMLGMNMDPMTMQNMYMNGDYQGMGMNNMGNFGGGFGQGSGNDWDGSQSWNFDQNNYNHSGAFGNFNSGSQHGFNQGGYGNHYNDYRQGGYFRGRGRGRGYFRGYGRGGYNSYGGRMNYQQDQGQHMTNQQQYGQASGDYAHGQGQTQNQAASVSSDVDELGRTIKRPGNPGDNEQTGSQSQSNTAKAQESPEPQERAGEGDARNVVQANSSAPGAIQSVLQGPEVPINAPTGPKAMRQGLPNTSLHHLRARGFQVGGPPDMQNGNSSHEGSHPRTMDEGSPQRDGDRDRDRDTYDDADQGKRRDRSRERSRSRDRRSKRDYERDEPSRDRDYSRSASPPSSRTSSRSRGHKASHRRRHRHEEDATDDHGSDGHRHRKKHRSSRKHRHDAEEGDFSTSREDKHEDRSRSESPAESRRSSHRRHRDKDYDKRKDGYDERKKSSHRSHRDRDRDHEHGHGRRRDRDKDREKDRERDKGKDRDRDRDRDRDKTEERDRRDRSGRHREKEKGKDSQYKYNTSGSRRASHDEGQPVLNTEPAEAILKPPKAPRSHNLSIKGSSLRAKDKMSSDSRRELTSEDRPSSSLNNAGSGKDPHALEREARNRERLLKETMRMALAGTKRHRDKKDDGEDEAGSGSGSRRRRSKRDGDES